MREGKQNGKILPATYCEGPISSTALLTQRHLNLSPPLNVTFADEQATHEANDDAREVTPRVVLLRRRESVARPVRLESVSDENEGKGVSGAEISAR